MSRRRRLRPVHRSRFPAQHEGARRHEAADRAEAHRRDHAPPRACADERAAARRVRERAGVQFRDLRPGLSRFRVNVFVQQQHVGMVIRTIATEIPNFEKLGLPETLKDVVMTKRGLVLVVGATGSGKSTSLAAMIDHRNRTSAGHIITVEDPVEYVHQSQKSPDHAPRSRRRHALVAPRAEEHAAPGAGRDPDRRDPRHRDDGARDRVRRDRPPVPGHAAREQRQPDASTASSTSSPRSGASSC